MLNSVTVWRGWVCDVTGDGMRSTGMRLRLRVLHGVGTIGHARHDIPTTAIMGFPRSANLSREDALLGWHRLDDFVYRYGYGCRCRAPVCLVRRGGWCKWSFEGPLGCTVVHGTLVVHARAGYGMRGNVRGGIAWGLTEE